MSARSATGWMAPVRLLACWQTTARVSAWRDDGLDLLGADRAGRVGVDEHDLDAELREVEERPRDGVVLHRARDDPVARREQPAQHQVHRLGASRREEQVMSVGNAEKRGDVASRLVDQPRGRHRHAVGAAAGVAAVDR